MYNGMLLSHEENETRPSAATWMDTETVILSEVTQRQVSYDIACRWNLKKWFRDFPGG